METMVAHKSRMGGGGRDWGGTRSKWRMGREGLRRDPFQVGGRFHSNLGAHAREES